jgi:hypothetical protein
MVLLVKGPENGLWNRFEGSDWMIGTSSGLVGHESKSCRSVVGSCAPAIKSSNSSLLRLG